MTRRKITRKKKKSEIREWSEALGFALVAILLIRIFVADLYTVSNSSMEGSLRTGDFVLVSKMHPGARIPITPLTIPFTHDNMPWDDDQKSYLDWIQFPYKRLPGFGSIEHNDILLFNHPEEIDKPIDHRTFSAKRCVALPGEEYELDGLTSVANGVPMEPLNQQKFTYHIKCDSIALGLPMVPEAQKISNRGDWRALLTTAQADSIIHYQHVTNVVRLEEKYGTGSEYIFPGTNKRGWNVDHFGPIKVPAAGDSVYLTPSNLDLYALIITKHEKRQLSVDEGLIYIDQKVTDYFIPKMDYYIVMGDNRHNSNDSRYWGFLPESHIVGTVTSILYRAGDKEDQESRSFFIGL